LFQLSKKTCYGLRALFELALAHGKGPVTTALIAEKQSIPIPFLEQIFYELNKGGIIASKRGPGGGHRLAKRPEDIKFSDIIQILEGPEFLFDCLGTDADLHACKEYNLCPSRLFVKQLARKIKDIFDNFTMTDLIHIWVEEVRKKH